MSGLRIEWSTAVGLLVGFIVVGPLDHPWWAGFLMAVAASLLTTGLGKAVTRFRDRPEK